MNGIAAKQHAAIEYSHGIIQQDGTSEKNKALFGFAEGKISLIREYW